MTAPRRKLGLALLVLALFACRRAPKHDTVGTTETTGAELTHPRAREVGETESPRSAEPEPAPEPPADEPAEAAAEAPSPRRAPEAGTLSIIQAPDLAKNLGLDPDAGVTTPAPAPAPAPAPPPPPPEEPPAYEHPSAADPTPPGQFGP